MSVQEIVGAVIERSIKIAITTAEHIIKKDFALDPDECRMRNATHHMVRNLTAAMAMITCRDYLATNITKSIKQGLATAFSRVSVLSLVNVLYMLVFIMIPEAVEVLLYLCDLCLPNFTSLIAPLS